MAAASRGKNAVETERLWFRWDLHVHTCFSYDSSLSLATLTQRVTSLGLHGVAVLDHDTIEGAQELRELAPFGVIVGEEIGSKNGGIAGLFLEEGIPPHLSAEETIERIHGQGGLVLVPHPFSRAVPGRMCREKLARLIGEIDLLEGYNARARLARDDRYARAFAERHGKPVTGGSDAHFSSELGAAWTEMGPFADARGFLSQVSSARLRHGRKTPVLLPLMTLASIPLLALRRRLAHR